MVEGEEDERYQLDCVVDANGGEDGDHAPDGEGGAGVAACYADAGGGEGALAGRSCG